MANWRAARSRALSTSAVTDTGRPTITCGAGLPAAAAASVMDGMMRLSTTDRPAIQVMVPSDSSPASRSMAGPRAATRMGKGSA